MRKIPIVLPALMCALLSSCGNPEPSSANIQAGLQNYMLGPKSKVIDAEYMWIDGAQHYRQYLTAEKVACSPSQSAPGHVCDFSLKICFGAADEHCEPQMATLSGRFSKTDKGWRYVPSDIMALTRPVDIIEDYAYARATRYGGAAGN